MDIWFCQGCFANSNRKNANKLSLQQKTNEGEKWKNKYNSLPYVCRWYIFHGPHFTFISLFFLLSSSKLVGHARFSNWLTCQNGLATKGNAYRTIRMAWHRLHYYYYTHTHTLQITYMYLYKHTDIDSIHQYPFVIIE